MSFTITRKLEQVPSYQMLWKLAEENHVCLTGNERNGSFSCRGMEGDYEFGAGGIQGIGKMVIQGRSSRAKTTAPWLVSMAMATGRAPKRFSS